MSSGGKPVNPPSKHHYVPVFYLERFAIRPGEGVDAKDVGMVIEYTKTPVGSIHPNRVSPCGSRPIVNAQIGPS